MNWIKSKKENIISIILTDYRYDVHQVNICPTKYVPTTDEFEKCGFDTKYLSIRVTYKPTINKLKKLLLSIIDKYDKDKEINSFTVNNQECWFDKETRVGLKNILDLLKLKNVDNYTIWFNRTPINLPIEKAYEFLADLEDYASKCYDATQKHIVEINNLTTLDECTQYDITTYYPPKLKFNF